MNLEGALRRLQRQRSSEGGELGSIGIYGPLRITLARLCDIRRHDPCDLEAHKGFYEHTHTELPLESGAR